METQVNTLNVDRNQEGYLTDFSQWNKEVGERIAKEEDPVAGPIPAGEIAIGAPDLPVEPAAGDDIAGAAPILPLQPGLVIDRQRRPTDLIQELVGEARIALEPFGQRRHCAIENENMGHLAPVMRLTAPPLPQTRYAQIGNPFDQSAHRHRADTPLLRRPDRDTHSHLTLNIGEKTGGSGRYHGIF